MLTTTRNLVLACVLSALAGYVDSIGFLHLGGLFVSFMSGNSTRLGVSLAEGQYAAAGDAFSLIALFVLGALGGSLIVLSNNRYRQSWVLLVEGLLLAGGAACYAAALDHFAIAAIVLAMAIENAIFQVEGGGGLGVTYVTGALVKVGQMMAVALTGGARFAWVPNLLLWIALTAGAVAGAVAYHTVNLSAIWAAAGVSLALSALLAVGVARH